MADPLVEPREDERIARIRSIIGYARFVAHLEDGLPEPSPDMVAIQDCADAEAALDSVAADLSRLQTVEAERDTALQALAEIATHGCYHYHDPDSCLSEGEPEVCARCIAVAAAGEPRE